MLKGYMNRIARIDLTSEKVSYATIDEAVARKYFGGVGLAANMLWEETNAETDPLSPQSPLIFMAGPLTGTMAPSSSRFLVVGLSPLTGIWGESHSGGDWAYELRHAGFDGVVVQGQARRPVYLWLHDGKAEIRDAGRIWGKDTYETDELIKAETDREASVACIGRAGERLVRIACIMNDGKKARAAARCGLGALMGSKKLKAIAARGTLPVNYHDEEKMKKVMRSYHRAHPRNKPEETIEVEVLMAKELVKVGAIPVKNWSEGEFEPAYKLCDELRKTKPMYCKGCSVGCLESKLTLEGERHMVYEHWGPMGTSCLVGDAEALQQAYSLCSRYGLDSISTGGVIAFGMECFDKGLVTRDDADGVELNWGNQDAMLEMVRKIGEREGFGELLGEGVKRAAERIGGLASEYAMHVKGLEFPAAEPRAGMSVAVEYATESIGAGHVEAILARGIENYLETTLPHAHPDLGYPAALDRLATEGKGVLTARVQNLGCMLNCLVVCCFEIVFRGIQPSAYLEMIKATTGWSMDLKEFMQIGERVINLKRMFDVRRGISRKDDTLPARILSHKRGAGKSADVLPFLGPMLNEYYTYRGWSEEGIPTREKLTELGLEQCLSFGR